MAKKKKINNNLIIGGLAVVGVGVLYMRGAFDKLISNFKSEKAKDDVVDVDPIPKVIAPTQEVVKKVVTPKVSNPLQDAGYLSKVKNLQLFLGVGVDGDAGKGTNLALKKKFPILYLSLGDLKPSNIDKYTDAKNNLGKVTRAQQVFSSAGAGKPATITKTAKYNAVFYDASSKTYKGTGGAFFVKQGTKIYKSNMSPSAGGKIVALNVPSFSMVKGVETSVGVRNLLLDPNNMYV